MTAGGLAADRPEVRIDRSDVGRRVSTRRVAELVEGRPVFRDVIGVLTSWDDHGLTVVPRSGEAVTFPEKLLVAGKTVPLFPARRAPMPTATPVELQRIAARGWPAVEHEQLGEWTLRAAAGFTRRANSVQTLGDPGIPLDDAFETVRKWYEARGIEPIVEITTPGSPDVLADRVVGREFFALVRTAPLAPLTRIGTGHDRVRLSRTASAEWMSRYGRLGDDPALKQAASQVLHGGPSVWFATVPDPAGGAPVAIGRVAIDGPWALFGAVEVMPYARRTGLATTVMAVLAARAAEERATGAYLQVEAENSGAIALYDKLGFSTSHTYHYARIPQR